MAIWQFLHDRTNLSSLLVGITLLILLTSALVTHMVETVAPSWGEVVGLGVALFIMTFCEVLPKSIGFARAEVLLVRWFPLWRFLVALFRPINRLVYAIAKRTLQLFGADPHRHPPLTLDEIFALLDAGVEAGVIDREEHALAERILRLEEIVVRDIMVPRPDIVALPADSTFDEVMETILQTGHSRLPLYDGTLDNIVGIVYAYDILANIADGTRQPTPRLIARPPSSSQRPSECGNCCKRCAPTKCKSPSSWTSMGRRQVWSLWKTSWKRSSANLGMSMTAS
jgi:putative hemolysin